ncbi:MAG: hypothetical protein V7739_03265 [Motiliproteus sp.]
MNLDINQLREYMTPLQEWQDSHENAVSKLFKLQQYYVNDVMGASFDQFKSLSKCADTEQAMKLNFYFCKGLEAHANYLSNETLATLNEAHYASLKTWDEASDKLANSLDELLAKNIPALSTND